MESKSSVMPRLGYVPLLDGMRGVAMVAVFLFNGGWHVFKGGYYGVDMFFVLSGFLITTLLCEEWLCRGAINLGSYFYRRSLRLLPALVLLVLVISTFSLVMHSGAKRRGQLLEGVATLLYVVNWTTLLKVARGGAFAHCWSLAVEGQFYVAWVFIIRFLVNGRQAIGAFKRVLLASLCIVAACIVWRIFRWSTGVPWYWLYLGTDCRLDSIFIGCSLGALRLLALGTERIEHIRQLSRVLCNILVPVSYGVAGFLLLTHEVESKWPYLLGFPLISICSGIWIWSGSMAPESFGLSIFRNPILVWLGRVSYSLYLWHFCVFSLLNMERLQSWGIVGFTASMFRGLVSLAMACFSYYVIESRFLSRRREARQDRVS